MCADLTAGISPGQVSIIPDRISLIYTDLPLTLSGNSGIITKYVGMLKQIAFDALEEEAILVSVSQVFHAM
ncbi:MAG: hypothetical protein M3525_15555 [Acidobacteriota bacterium]|nr:hypothetical protein [Acidobacteriota bacterium]